MVANLMNSIGLAARAAAPALELASSDQKNRALQAAAEALGAGRREILAANEQDMRAARAPRRDRRAARSAEARRPAGRLDGTGARGHRPPARPDRHGARRVDPAERHADSAPARAAGRDRDHLREPPERHRGCGCVVLEIRERGDPARRIGERAIERRHARLPASGSRRRGPAERLRSSWCRPPIARPSATCSPRCARISTSSCRAAASS